MKKRVVLAAFLAVPLFAIALAQGQQRPAAPRTETGRFQIVAQPATNEVLGGVFLLDTSTGRVWRQIELENADGDDNGLVGAPRVWVPMTRFDSGMAIGAFLDRHPKK